jgi:hypothetical protein
MATVNRPQFHPNDLEPVPITLPSLLAALQELRSAISQAHRLLEEEFPAPDATDQSAFGNVFTGHLGMYL